jgi:transposase
MSRQVNFTLNAEQVEIIREAMNTSPHPEVRQRATAIHLLHLGHPPEAVAAMLAVGTSTIWTWHRRWRRDGLKGLVNQARSGRPTKATEAYVHQLDVVIEQDPAELGLSFALWTINRLRLYLAEQTGILLSYTRFRALLSRQHYVWREPKHDLSALQDKDAQVVAKEALEWLKKTPRFIPSRPSNSSLWTKRP